MLRTLPSRLALTFLTFSLAACSGPSATPPTNAGAEDVNTAALGNTVLINAKADLAGGIGADMTVYVNGVSIGKQRVNATTAQNYTFTSASGIPGEARIDVFYSNDAVVSGKDRNLYVNSVAAGGLTYTFKSAGVTYDLGQTYAQATDGLDIRTTSTVMPWNGAMRFKLPADKSVPTKNEYANNTPVTGPVYLSSNMTLSGKKISNPNGPCVVVNPNSKNVVIENNEIGPCLGEDYLGFGVHIRQGDERFGNTWMGSENVTVRRNVIHDVSSGVVVEKARHPIVVERNLIYNVRGTKRLNQDGSVTSHGNAVAFHLVGVAGPDGNTGTGQSKIVGNVSDKNLATIATGYEDHISMVGAFGTAANPILVSCNRIRGGDSNSGSGIMTGDLGGAFIKVANNTLVYPANAGIGVAGGHDITVAGNRIEARGPNTASKTQGAAYLMHIIPPNMDPFWQQYNVTPYNISFTNNRGIATAWLYGNGSTWPGFFVDVQHLEKDASGQDVLGGSIPAGNYIDSGNIWGDTTLSPAIFEDIDPACK